MKLTDKPYSLSRRIAASYADTGDETECDIEYRSAHQKCTVASDVPDEIARLFVAAPDMLEVVAALVIWNDALVVRKNLAPSWLKLEAQARAALAKATPMSPCADCDHNDPDDPGQAAACATCERR